MKGLFVRKLPRKVFTVLLVTFCNPCNPSGVLQREEFNPHTASWDTVVLCHPLVSTVSVSVFYSKPPLRPRESDKLTDTVPVTARYSN